MKYIITILLTFLFFSCKAQLPKVKNLSNHQQLNYIFANIFPEKTIKKELFQGSFYVNIFQMSDSKATPKGYFGDGHEILYSFIVSVIPDGEYSSSALYKIEGLIIPKIIEIKESTYPKFIIKIEHGSFLEKRKVKSFEFEKVK